MFHKFADELTVWCLIVVPLVFIALAIGSILGEN